MLGNVDPEGEELGSVDGFALVVGISLGIELGTEEWVTPSVGDFVVCSNGDDDGLILYEVVGDDVDVVRGVGTVTG